MPYCVIFTVQRCKFFIPAVPGNFTRVFSFPWKNRDKNTICVSLDLQIFNVPTFIRFDRSFITIKQINFDKENIRTIELVTIGFALLF